MKEVFSWCGALSAGYGSYLLLFSPGQFERGVAFMLVGIWCVACEIREAQKQSR